MRNPYRLGWIFFVVVCGPSVAAASVFLLGFPNNLYRAFRGQIEAEIPVNFSHFSEKPLVKVQIEKSTYLLLLDSGCSASLNLREKPLRSLEIKNKTSACHFLDARGNVYESSRYRIPSIRIGELNLKDISLIAENDDFIKFGSALAPFKGKINARMEKILSVIDGSIGRGILVKFDCLFDLSNSRLLLIRQQKGRQETRLLNRGFVKIPFELNRCGVILTCKTDLGDLNLLLDSGATHSILRKNLVASPDACEWKTPLSIAEKQFRCWNFRLFDIGEQLPEFDGILGVDFFLKNTIYLDFVSRVLYLKI